MKFYIHLIKFVKATTESESKDENWKTDQFVFAILKPIRKLFEDDFLLPVIARDSPFFDAQDGLNVGVYANIIDDTFFVIYKTLDPGVLLKWALTCLINIKFANTNLPTVTLVLDTCFFPKL